MAFELYTRVLETFATTGTGTITLAGAVSGYRTFASVLDNSDTVHYFMEGGADYEIGYGTYSAGTLARTTVLKSSNSNNAVSWASGTKTVGIAPLGPSDLDATNMARWTALFAASDTLAGAIEIAIQSEMETGTDVARAVTPGRQHYHPSAAKAWCNFNSAGTIAASYNITSITDSGTGDWTINIATDFSSASFAGVVTGGYNNASSMPIIYDCRAVSAGTFRIYALRRDTGALMDPDSPDVIMFIGFGDQ